MKPAAASALLLLLGIVIGSSLGRPQGFTREAIAVVALLLVGTCVIVTV